MSDINWDEKPDWADVWLEDLCDPKASGWHSYCKAEDRYYDANNLFFSGKNENIAIHYPPETKPVWNGVGIPPVGTVCEFSSEGHHDGFMWCIFRGCMSDGGFIIEYHHATSPEMVTCDCFDPDLTKFRPIKSDKERWVDDSLSILLKNPAACPREYMGMLYDALISGELPLPKGDK